MKNWNNVLDSLPNENEKVKAVLQNFYTLDKIEKVVVFNNTDWFTSDNKPLPFDYDVLCWKY